MIKSLLTLALLEGQVTEAVELSVNEEEYTALLAQVKA